MNNDDFEYDPERAIWKPGRRTFLFMLGAAAAGTIVSQVTKTVVVVPGIEIAGAFDTVRLLPTINPAQGIGATPTYVLEDALVRARGLGAYVNMVDERKPVIELQFKTNSQGNLTVQQRKTPFWPDEKGAPWTDEPCRKVHNKNVEILP